MRKAITGPCARFQVQSLVGFCEERLHSVSEEHKVHHLQSVSESHPGRLTHRCWDLHHPADELLMFFRYVCRAFGGGRRDVGRCPYTVGVLVPPLLRLLPQVSLLLLVQVRDSCVKKKNHFTNRCTTFSTHRKSSGCKQTAG